MSNLAFLLAELGDLAEARRTAEEGLATAQRFSNRPHEATCRQALAQIAAQGGQIEPAFLSRRIMAIRTMPIQKLLLLAAELGGRRNGAAREQSRAQTDDDFHYGILH